jgi:3-hydroxyisobutyrate dehydrogenase-like beta-hydroxyacid dehydrogenase
MPARGFALVQQWPARYAAEMAERIGIIGFGEAARAFVAGGLPAIAAYDRDPARRDGIARHACSADMLRLADVVLCLVSADQALAAAHDAALHMAPGALYLDMNSVAPATKRAAALVVAAAGGRYADVAIMAPVLPARLAVPLLVCGSHADAAAAALRQGGFSSVRALPGSIGQASAVKMIRSIMIKGTEALTAEMLRAAAAAGVTDAVLESLGSDWPARADYNLDRMLVHGGRRAAEMREVAATLDALGIDPVMTGGTIRVQASIGSIGAAGKSPAGLAAKLALLA